MKTASHVVHATADGKRVKLPPEQAKANGIQGKFYLRWYERNKVI